MSLENPGTEPRSLLTPTPLSPSAGNPGLPSAIGTHHLGVFAGEGIGPEVIGASLRVLEALEAGSAGRLRFVVEKGGPIGQAAIARGGAPLDPEAIAFCEAIFRRGGAVLAGAGGDRFVYECRRRFRLHYKLNPLVPTPVPLASRRIKEPFLSGVDILVVRENLEGIYQGTWELHEEAGAARVARHHFSYCRENVSNVIGIAVAAARQRRHRLTVVTKPNGIPAVSRLWLELARELTAESGVELRELEVDYACFALLQDPRHFDVVVTSNLFGDILADLGGLLLGSRGLCYGGSFSADGRAIYQTNHGAALDLAGTDTANPVGQILSMAMLLEHSFALASEAATIHRAVERVWRQGVRTADLAEPGCRVLGTRAMGERIAEAVIELLEAPAP